jgi:hypothetical protein
MLRIILAISLLLIPFSFLTQASVIEYTDYSAWLGAASAEPNVDVATEEFQNGRINTLGVSVTTRSGMGTQIGAGNGQIVDGAWVDCVGKNACNGSAYDTTAFYSAKPMYAFGGTWNLPAAYPGGLELSMDTSPQIISPNQYASGPYSDGSAFSGFFGFVSDSPFSSVTLGSSYGSQSLTLTDMVLGIDPPPAAVPEPAFLLPLGLLAVWGVKRKYAK